MKPITIGFSIHRSEVIDITTDLMHHHDVIFLEEPPANGLQEMLQGALSILIEKGEVTANLETFPHVRNELACIRAVKLLTLEDCDRLFPLIRNIKTVHARQIVDDYLVRI